MLVFVVHLFHPRVMYLVHTCFFFFFEDLKVREFEGLDHVDQEIPVVCIAVLCLNRATVLYDG